MHIAASILSTITSSSAGIIAIILCICIFIILLIIVSTIICWTRRRRAMTKHVTIRNPAQITNAYENETTLPRAMMSNNAYTNNLALISRSGLDPVAFLSGSATTVKADDSDLDRNQQPRDRLPLWYRNGAMTDSSLSLSNNLAGTANQSDAIHFVPERYDLDNVSSIAPSDIDVTKHYRAIHGQARHGSKQLEKQPVKQPRIALK